MNPNVIIVGGGLAGLTAARQIHENGLEFLLLEASDRIGGRVKTDLIDGFRLDHGFQVLLTAYPEVSRWLDYSKLDLKEFIAGAILLYPNGEQGQLGDPLRSLSSLIPTIFNKSTTLKDKISILKLRNRLADLSIEEIFEQEEISTLEALRGEYGFSEKMISDFFSPFFSGIFLEKELSTSRRMFDFVFKMFSEASTAVPNLGMEEIPKLLAEPLPKESMITGARVVKIEKQTVHLSDGSTFTAPHIIVATEATGIVKELSSVKTGYRSTTHVHFIAEEAPIKKRMIALNTSPERLTNNICVMNTIAPGYSSGSQSLISLSIVGNATSAEAELLKAIRKELQKWFGNKVQDWEHLHTRIIKYALPDQSKVRNSIPENDFQIRNGLYVCGDHLLNGSINAAMKVGREVGELVGELD